MAEMLSPGVFVTEIDASTIAPTVSNSIGVFAGKFDKGPVGAYMLITNVDELIQFYGLPSNQNYNDWYQVYNFLQYGNKLYLARASNVVDDGNPLSTNALADAISEGGTATVSSVLDPSVSGSDYVAIGNDNEFENIESSIPMTGTDPKLRFIARNPGDWGNKIEIAIAKPEAFDVASTDPQASPQVAPTEVFDGIVLDELFEYFPTGTEVGVVIRVDGEIKETFRVDFDETARDANNKSSYIERVINGKSNYVFVKENTLNTTDIANHVFSIDSNAPGSPATEGVISLAWGSNAPIQQNDLMDAYDLWANKEEVDIDIVIANELAPAVAKNLADTRKDCIAFMGAAYGSVVGEKASQAVSNLIEARKTGDFNFNSMFCVLGGNYKYQYDRYNDKNRWVNIAGDIAGLRAQTSTNRASWWASAGLDRGQIKNVKKLAYNPTQGHRDVLYKNGINPIVSFPGQGNVMWGQKTLLAKPSSFDRVNVRGLFNTIERSLSKMAKFQVMEFNDNFTRNRIVSMIKPFLQSVQAGRGIQDFLVIADESNNTPDVISRNQLVVDIYIKPTYVAEFIHLKFTNAGTNNFSEVVGG